MGKKGGTLYTRLANHLSTIRTQKQAYEYPVASHFTSEGHSIAHLQVVGLERVWSKEVFYRRLREKRWIELLGTNQENGAMNIKKSMNAFMIRSLMCSLYR